MLSRHSRLGQFLWTVGPRFVAIRAVGVVAVAIAASFAAAQPAASSAAGMVALIESGRVPPERLGTLVKLVCERGTPADLAVIWTRAVDENGWPVELRREALLALLAAARERGVFPAGERSRLAKLLAEPESPLALPAAQLAGVWKEAGTVDALVTLATKPDTNAELRGAALDALAAIDSARARAVIAELNVAHRPAEVRAQAIAALFPLDTSTAAQAAAELLRDAEGPFDPAPLMRAVLEARGGSTSLAAAWNSAPPPRDRARLLLREMYALGRSDPELTAVLSRAAGLQREVAIPTAEEMTAFVQRVEAQGDAARGEAVFRRADLACLRCHAVSGAGGQVGPDLSAVGTVSPIGFLAMSLIDPDQAIKETHQSRIVVTTAGRIHQGLVHQRTESSLTLKDAGSRLTTIPAREIEEEVAGKSLMPRGLVNSMTDAEFVDLVAFLSQLGRSGPWLMRWRPTAQRYRVLVDPPAALIELTGRPGDLDPEQFEGTRWEPAYARVNGDLPLSEFADRSRSGVLHFYTEVEVQDAGDVELKLDSASGVRLWLDGDELTAANTVRIATEPGRRRVDVRIDASSRLGDTFAMEFAVPNGSNARIQTVDGE